MPTPFALIERALPENPLARRLSLQSMLFASGEGAFMTASAVFFTHIMGLRAAQVGLGLTIAGVVGFALAVPMGKLADRFGGQRMWVLGSFGLAVTVLLWPWLRGFAAFVAMQVALQLLDSTASAGRQNYSLNAFTRAERVKSQAYMRSALNIGFTIGAGVGGIALGVGNDQLIRMLPLALSLIVAINAVMVLRLPAIAASAEGPESSAATAITPGALRNRGFLALMLGDGVLATNQVLLNVVIPLWLVEATDAPRVLLAWLFGTNTIMAVLLQVPAARGVDTVAASLRAARRAAVFFVVSCAIIAFTHETLGWITIFLVWLGHVTVTGAELFQSASNWGFVSELSEPDKRGEYSGAARLGRTSGMVFAPALYTWLAMNWQAAGWAVIAAIVVASTAAMHPAARAAERYLERHGVTVD